MNIIRPPGSSTLPRFRPVNQRRRVTVVAITLAACTIIGTAAWTFGVNSASDFTTECQREDYVAPTPDRVAVNVYNGTQIVGLGVVVADELKKRGFLIGKVDNDPLRRKIRGTGELRGGPLGGASDRQINALQAWQPGMVIVRDPKGKGPIVDFVLGAKFDKLRDVPEPPPGTPKSACKPDQPAS